MMFWVVEITIKNKNCVFYNENGEKEMIDEKIKVDTSDFSKTDGIIVSPYMSDINQRSLIEIYLQELFSTNNDTQTYNLISAENSLLLATLELCTNIAIVGDSDGKITPVLTLNDVYANINFVKDLFSKMVNYSDFKSTLYRTVEIELEKRRIEASLGNKLELLYNKVIEFIDNLSNITPEQIESIKGMLKEVEGSEVLKESLSVFKNQKT